ncbi:hypothetical protein A3B18_02920 [Candidatus Giovannonibacteria bacterium RIFCSPLOWO2_01_FULL_46_13]|uniref:Uncharacterized protein n=1 Tax=Candidatus Giovannonibacteria bacterium RIFCSPLOWO2_01_FULL_46_13 TaxID=1798352 RepID=A0A1F5X2Z5_9BACT|nr:MAG: hypothetical protein A3B18_02920 [Candidatus Giovannonibacteria bacterium RIFCSPLOWO2_01_FULL_46_13]
MTKLLELIFNKIRNTEVVINKGPTDKVAEGEVREFILEDEELKKLYWFVAQAERNLERAMLKIRQRALDCAERNEDFEKSAVFTEIARELIQLGSICYSLQALFWNSFAYEFPELAGKRFEIREGWQVISNRKQEAPLSAITIGIPQELLEKIMTGNIDPQTPGKKETVH